MSLYKRVKSTQLCQSKSPNIILSPKEVFMPDSTYKIIELVGTSDDSWEQATRNAIQKASESLHDMRIAEVVQQDVTIENGKIQKFRTRLSVSFKYQK